MRESQSKSEMPNLKQDNFTLRGKVGEVIARSHLPFSSRTNELTPKYLYKRFSFGFIPDDHRNFLIRNWKSFDLIRLIVSEDKTQLVGVEIYEVKTQSHNRIHRPEITKNCLRVYQKALQLGIKVKLVHIIFFENWDYEINVKDFEVSDFDLNDGNTKTSNYANFLIESALLHRKVRGTWFEHA